MPCAHPPVVGVRALVRALGFCAAVGSCWIALGLTTALAENWPQWRGPLGTGVSGEKGLPIAWNESRGILWRTPLPEWGTSTPAIWNEALFVTSHADDKLLLLKLDTATGRIAWTRTVGTGTAPRTAEKRSTQKFHDLHNLASPSPVTNGQVVVVHYGNGELACYDFAGELHWRRNLADDFGPYTIWWGHANSPVLSEGLVISVCMQDSLADVQAKAAPSYLIAHDLRDGHVKWQVDRNTGAQAEQCDAYTTPLLVDVAGARQLVVMGGNQLDAYEPATGKLLWKLPGLVGGRTVTGPTFGNDRLFCTHGMRGPLLAVNVAGAAGDLSPRSIAWKYTEGSPDSCTPVLWEGLLFTVTDDGIARCFEADTGAVRWKERLPGKYKASPVVAEGRLFFLNTEGLCSVVSAAPRFDLLIQNQLPDETIASPALSAGRIYLRGRKSLYCVGR